MTMRRHTHAMEMHGSPADGRVSSLVTTGPEVSVSKQRPRDPREKSERSASLGTECRTHCGSSGGHLHQQGGPPDYSGRNSCAAYVCVYVHVRACVHVCGCEPRGVGHGGSWHVLLWNLMSLRVDTGPSTVFLLCDGVSKEPLPWNRATSDVPFPSSG